MRILFSCQAVAGHMLPMLPLERAAREAGHVTALMTTADLAELLSAEVRLLPVGEPFAVAVAETIRRTGGGDPSEFGPAAAELFAGVTVDLAFDDALRAATAFEPDLLVCDPVDVTGRLVAAALEVPWALHRISGAIPEPFVTALDGRAERQYAQRSLTADPPVAVIDPYPAVLGGPADGAADHLALRPSPHRDVPRSAPGPLVAMPDGARPTVLLTVGTSLQPDHEGDPLTELLAATTAAGVDVVVTAGPAQLGTGADADGVYPVGFVPLADLLPVVDAVVTMGGTGTVLAALAAGLPMVVWPLQADQPLNGQRVAAAGVGLAVQDADGVTAALRRVLAEAGFREAAERAARSIASMPGPERVLEGLLHLVRASSAITPAHRGRSRPGGPDPVRPPRTAGRVSGPGMARRMRALPAAPGRPTQDPAARPPVHSVRGGESHVVD